MSIARLITIALTPIVTIIVKVIMWALNRVVLIIVQFLRIINATIKTTMTHVPGIVANFIPRKIGNGLNQQLIFAGVEMTADEVISITLVYSIVLAVVALIISIALGASQLITGVVVLIAFGAVWALPIVLLGLLTNNRTNAVEDTLPDVLSMVAQNMKAGMTSYNALWSAARPEFGPLAVELQDVAKATLTGIPLTDALVGMTNHVKSTKLPRSIRLVVQGMKSGGDLPAVLQAITQDMRKEQSLRRQMAAETSAHSIFILFAIMIGAPLLFAVSLQFITIFSNMMAKLKIDELSKNTPGTMIKLGKMTVTPDQFQLYAIAIMTISGTFAALLVGILKTGNPLTGIPSILPYIVIPILIFLGLKVLLNVVFAGMINL